MSKKVKSWTGAQIIDQFAADETLYYSDQEFVRKSDYEQLQKEKKELKERNTKLAKWLVEPLKIKTNKEFRKWREQVTKKFEFLNKLTSPDDEYQAERSYYKPSDEEKELGTMGVIDIIKSLRPNYNQELYSYTKKSLIEAIDQLQKENKLFLEDQEVKADLITKLGQLQKEKEAIEDYAKLLLKELNSCVSIAHIHGWRSGLVKEGEEARAKLRKLGYDLDKLTQES